MTMKMKPETKRVILPCISLAVLAAAALSAMLTENRADKPDKAGTQPFDSVQAETEPDGTQTEEIALPLMHLPFLFARIPHAVQTEQALQPEGEADAYEPDSVPSETAQSDETARQDTQADTAPETIPEALPEPAPETQEAAFLPVPSDRDDAHPGLEYVTDSDGNATVTGIGGYTGGALLLPELVDGHPVIGIAPHAFRGCGHITIVYIPETVINIGKGAFADCPGLVMFAVSPRNPVYSSADGVLFEGEGTVLLRYPPARPGGTYTLPAGLCAIADGAFSGVKQCGTILYPGSPAAWEKLYIGYGNNALAGALQFALAGKIAD